MYSRMDYTIVDAFNFILLYCIESENFSKQFY